MKRIGTTIPLHWVPAICVLIGAGYTTAQTQKSFPVSGSAQGSITVVDGTATYNVASNGTYFPGCPNSFAMHFALRLTVSKSICCQIEVLVCGNGILNSGEDCDGGTGCSSDCSCNAAADYGPYSPAQLGCTYCEYF